MSVKQLLDDVTRKFWKCLHPLTRSVNSTEAISAVIVLTYFPEFQGDEVPEALLEMEPLTSKEGQSLQSFMRYCYTGVHDCVE